MTKLDKDEQRLENKGSGTEDYSSLLEKIKQKVEEENKGAKDSKEVSTTKVTEEKEQNDSNQSEVPEQEVAYVETLDKEAVDEISQDEIFEVEESIEENYQEEVYDKRNNFSNEEIVLEVLGIKKRIGLKTIVDDITFDMRRGEIIGLLGPNGSGKTTIMRMMTGLTKITKGDIYCFEKPLGLGNTKMMKEIGSMIESPEFYNYMSGWANLKQIARACGKKVSKQRMKELVEFVELEDVINKKVKTYSLGMRQRLGLAQALLNDPKILILDEPVNGLDPQGVQDFRNKLKEIANTGVSILISSHLLDEIEKVCDRIIVIEKGHIIADDTLDMIKNDNIEKTLITTYDDAKAKVLIDDTDVPYELVEGGFVFSNLTREDKAKVITYLVTNNVEIDSVKVISTSLEERFLEITGKGGNE